VDKIPPVPARSHADNDVSHEAPFVRNLGLLLLLLFALLALMVSAAATAPKPITPETLPSTR
jgi:hypothetical protein